MTGPATRSGSAEITLVGDTAFQIVRRFDAPAARVFEVWTTPEHICRWWSDETRPLTECTVDLRVGGAWRYAIDGPDGRAEAWRGTYLEIVSGERIVSTEVYEGYPDAEAVDTLTLSEVDGTTTLTVTVRHKTRADRDGHVQSGMEAGLQAALDRVAVLAGSVAG